MTEAHSLTTPEGIVPRYDSTTLELYNRFKGWGNRSLHASDMITMVTLLIPMVQKLINGKGQGAYKKRIILDVLELIIGDSTLEPSDKQSLILVLHTTIPPVIDTLISVAKGDLDIGKIIKSTGCCLIA